MIQCAMKSHKRTVRSDMLFIGIELNAISIFILAFKVQKKIYIKSKILGSILLSKIDTFKIFPVLHWNISKIMYGFSNGMWLKLSYSFLSYKFRSSSMSMKL